MKLCRRVLLILTVFSLLSACLPASAASQVSVDVQGFMAVYDTYSEQYIRNSDGIPYDLGRNEYIAFALYVTNTSRSASEYKSVYFRVDGGRELHLNGFTLEPGDYTRCHIYHDNMTELGPGLHLVQFFLNKQEVYSERFYLTRDWHAIMHYPTAGLYAPEGGRAPYVLFIPRFGTKVISEYSIDFSIDDTADGTYFSMLSAEMDVSALRKKYKNLYNDYTYPGGFYCGFKLWDNDVRTIIMNVWDIFCEDKYGNRSVICATQLYPEYKRGVSQPAGEGSYQQFITEYPWQTHHPYRMLMQRSTSDTTGNAVLTMWICDLMTMQWDELVSWDLGYASAGINTAKAAGFLENFNPYFSPYVRNVNFSNIRGRNGSGNWTAVKSVEFYVDFTGTHNYTGSYDFGSDNTSFWIITTGVSGFGRNPEPGSTFSVKNISKEEPY